MQHHAQTKPHLYIQNWGDCIQIHLLTFSDTFGRIMLLSSIRSIWLKYVVKCVELNKKRTCERHSLLREPRKITITKLTQNVCTSDCFSLLLNSWHSGDLSPNSEDVFAFNTNTDVCCPCWTHRCVEKWLYSFFFSLFFSLNEPREWLVIIHHGDGRARRNSFKVY